MKTTIPVDEVKLRQLLAAKGFEATSMARSNSDDRIEVEANILHPVSINKADKLYVPVPVTLQVTLDNEQHIENIEGGTPPPEVTKDAEQFVETLVDNHQISGISGEAATNATHQIEVNDKGLQVIKRRGFSIF